MSVPHRKFEDDFEPPHQWTPEVEAELDEDEETVQFFPFMHNSDDFASGFEAGEFWAACERQVDSIEGNFRSDNKGELLRIAERHGYRLIVWGDEQEGFCFARFVRQDVAGYVTAFILRRFIQAAGYVSLLWPVACAIVPEAG